MDIFRLTLTQLIFFFTLYSITGVVPMMAALYLLLRRFNAISPGITPPKRLRRWAAAFFIIVTLAHLWWLHIFFFVTDLQSPTYTAIVLVDCVTLLTTAAGTLLSLLQDRRRPVWPVLAALLPYVMMGVAYMIHPSDLLGLTVLSYLLLFSLLFSVYMVYSVRRYERWLNDNYADLENKRVWLSLMVGFFFMLLFVLYLSTETNVALICLMHIVELVLIGLLLWRVETLPILVEPKQAEQHANESANINIDQIEAKLNEHCVAKQLYRVNDLTLNQLAQAVGSNRSYLSQYFSLQGINYNTYINNQRISHFIRRCQESAQTEETFTAQELASESGFRSYSTFSRAFTQRTGQSVTAWMRQLDEKRK